MLPEERGLSQDEARNLLAKYGQNKLPETPPPSNISLVISQIKSPLVYVLLAAFVATLAFGDIGDAVVISFAVIMNTVLGFFQEKKAGQSLRALKNLLEQTAVVIRNGERAKVNVHTLVPGDVVELHQGSKVPVDGEIIKVNRFFVSEAILTGESQPVAKEVKDEVFMGTIVTAGHAFVKCTKTGAATQIGKIAKKVQGKPEKTPIQKQLEIFSKQLTIIVLALITIVFVIGLLSGKPVAEIFVTSVALSVSAIPEGLLVSFTVILAVGMQKILSKKGLVRHLVSAETLGGVTIICLDKTGTLTEGKMRVVKAIGDEKLLAKQMILANDMDDPLVVAAWEWGEKNLRSDELVKKYKRIDSIPFSPKSRYFAALNEYSKNEKIIYVNGAPEYLIEKCNLDKAQKDKILSEMEELTERGMRVLGMISKKVSGGKDSLEDSDIKSDFAWIGMLALTDPVRADVKESIKQTEKAGIKTMVVTGDYAQTAVAVMHEAGLSVNENATILGEELEKMSEEELKVRIVSDGITLFARTTPDQKLKIVNALKENGEVVAMMGDGVNDAPALSKADIGIVVEESTDVARESADLVLLDSKFETIVDAVREGRIIFDNIRKVVLYLLCDAFEEIIAVLLTIVFHLPLPITAAQILWVNLISDGFPSLALTIDPARPNIMNDSPRHSSEKIVVPWMRDVIIIISAIGGLSAFGLFVFNYTRTGDIALARSVAFAAVGVNTLIYVFSIRTLKRPFWVERPFDNKWLNIAVIGGFILQAIPFVIRPVGEFFNVEELPFLDWVAVFGVAIFGFFVIEIIKYIFRHRFHKAHA